MKLRFVILLLVAATVGFVLALAWTARADDSGYDPTGVTLPPPYTGPAPAQTVLG
jgi:hypothetical protein